LSADRDVHIHGMRLEQAPHDVDRTALGEEIDDVLPITPPLPRPLALRERLHLHRHEPIRRDDAELPGLEAPHDDMVQGLAVESASREAYVEKQLGPWDPPAAGILDGPGEFSVLLAQEALHLLPMLLVNHHVEVHRRAVAHIGAYGESADQRERLPLEECGEALEERSGIPLARRPLRDAIRDLDHDVLRHLEERQLQVFGARDDVGTLLHAWIEAGPEAQVKARAKAAMDAGGRKRDTAPAAPGGSIRGGT